MENLGIIIAIVGSAIAIVGVTLTLMLWVRGEANADRRDIVNLIVAIKDQIYAIQLEMKDFHTKLTLQDQEFKTRLCAIEEKRK